jgi:hypothetical protein
MSLLFHHSFADYLGLTLPELKQETEEARKSAVILSLGSPRDGDEMTGGLDNENAEDSLFEDQETREFYQSLVDVRNIVPSVLLNTTSPVNDGKPSIITDSQSSPSPIVENIDEEIAKLESMNDDADLEKEQVEEYVR